MKREIYLMALVGTLLAGSCPSASAGAEAIRMVPFDQVRMDDVVWNPMTAKLVEKTLPHAFVQTEPAQERLRLCAEWLESDGTTPLPDPHRFNTSDLYKVMEGAAMMIQAEPNPEIERQMDRIIDIIARAQRDDGYLYVSHIVGNPEPGMGERPYSFLLHSHELYNIGHLYEAAAAYAKATGKTKFLDVAEKSAHHVNQVFFEGDPNYNDGKPVMQAPGHQEIELWLVWHRVLPVEHSPPRTAGAGLHVRHRRRLALQPALRCVHYHRAARRERGFNPANNPLSLRRKDRFSARSRRTGAL